MGAAAGPRDSVRLDRQLRIPGWDQAALSRAPVGVVGDGGRLGSLFLLSAAALGVNRLVVLAPMLDPILAGLARELNPDLDLAFLPGLYSHPGLDRLFSGVKVLVDLSSFGLANKLSLNLGFRQRLPVVRAFCFEEEREAGCAAFVYQSGGETGDLARLVAPFSFPGKTDEQDGVLAIIAAGLALEETKNLLMGQPVAGQMLAYRRSRLRVSSSEPDILVVGAGALGNFAGLGLALAGFRRLTFMDPDTVEATNLNRQVFFAGSVGKGKAETLAAELRRHYGVEARMVTAVFTGNTDLSPYTAVFDCVDNFETRIALSEACRSQGKVLVSGGAGVEAGQVVIFDPAAAGLTPAELLGLYEIVAQRGQAQAPLPRAREACIYQPDPAVIMTNQIIAGLMVDAYRQLLAGLGGKNFFYEAGRAIT